MTTLISPSFSSPTSEVGINTAIDWLYEVCREQSIGIDYILVEGFTGYYYPDENLIELGEELMNNSALYLQTLLHEVIHVMQDKHREFIATPLKGELLISSLNQAIPLEPMKELILLGWEDEYKPEDFEYLWLDEVAALLLQDSFYWFKDWYERNYK